MDSRSKLVLPLPAGTHHQWFHWLSGPVRFRSLHHTGGYSTITTDSRGGVPYIAHSHVCLRSTLPIGVLRPRVTRLIHLSPSGGPCQLLRQAVIERSSYRPGGDNVPPHSSLLALFQVSPLQGIWLGSPTPKTQSGRALHLLQYAREPAERLRCQMHRPVCPYQNGSRHLRLSTSHGQRRISSTKPINVAQHLGYAGFGFRLHTPIQVIALKCVVLPLANTQGPHYPCRGSRQLGSRLPDRPGSTGGTCHTSSGPRSGQCGSSHGSFAPGCQSSNLRNRGYQQSIRPHGDAPRHLPPSSLPGIVRWSCLPCNATPPPQGRSLLDPSPTRPKAPSKK